jgi:hypothetical protein
MTQVRAKIHHGGGPGEARTVAVFTSVISLTVLGERDVLDGGRVLPGFTLPVRDLFAELDRQGPKAKNGNLKNGHA